MVRIIKSQKNKNKGLIEDKDYITEVYLLSGKALGDIIKKKRMKKHND